MWHLLLDAALRPGEAFALKWSHIDLDAKLVRVRYTLARVGVNKAEQGWKLTKPKTERSRPRHTDLRRDGRGTAAVEEATGR